MKEQDKDRINRLRRNMEPKILSDEQEMELCKRFPLLDFSFQDDYREELDIMLQEQVEVCQRVYEPLIQQAKDLAALAEYARLTIKHSEMMAEQVEGWRKRVLEAKAEVARQMIEEANELSSGGTLHDDEGYIVLSPKAIQSLKSRYTGGQK